MLSLNWYRLYLPGNRLATDAEFKCHNLGDSVVIIEI